MCLFLELPKTFDAPLPQGEGTLVQASRSDRFPSDPCPRGGDIFGHTFGTSDAANPYDPKLSDYLLVPGLRR